MAVATHLYFLYSVAFGDEGLFFRSLAKHALSIDEIVVFSFPALSGIISTLMPCTCGNVGSVADWQHSAECAIFEFKNTSKG